MIASDTSTWIAFLEGNSGDDVEMLTKALGDRQHLKLSGCSRDAIARADVNQRQV